MFVRSGQEFSSSTNAPRPGHGMAMASMGIRIIMRPVVFRLAVIVR
jgi:hypothetical protein